jgi:hypothetical protein
LLSESSTDGVAAVLPHWRPAGLVWASLLLELTLAVGCLGVTAKIVRGRLTSRAECDAAR